MIDEFKKRLKDFTKLRSELTKESDRGMSLYATAYIDKKLEILLKKKLIGSNKHLKEIFSFNGPVGTFSSKIKLAYSIGLIDKVIMSDINILRQIRNEFAHSEKNISFETDSIRKSCNKLKTKSSDDMECSREIFLNVASGISGVIAGVTVQTEKFEEKIPIDIEEKRSFYKKIKSLDQEE
ncbi:MltR family transcriptional regulator [Psychroserpens ponticola]|uniref:MltR family transcriptional regulator n=1 Tax=Psychroserpens ponticola TaxID=2932268 RepID=A0ABY7S2A6_9FLAO|nr:MltR family transcriptional regulator [Psychroserpens ponticola]WCO03518.1 MltR family transcriptional regulator [Psychroserpens ponticola]